MRPPFGRLIDWLNKPTAINDDPNNVVELVHLPIAFEAEELVELLKHVGIQASVFGLQTTLQIGNVPGGFRVMVRAGDMAEARIVLSDFGEELAKRRSR